ncbi:UNKNOWN [Stylonychia lemnae]|uniref:Protein kinase domain containing protein n=1 Tax=Stylonychia lemnae TaxID=5949 RepID=A0A077ZUD0_STYLE|nr:UNKNOWN [Stylonychia lemnae]|eukprot:CDW73477.1 UNKNOWN [Stylonychia lemnae]
MESSKNQAEFHDYLSFRHDTEILSALDKQRNEKIIFSTGVIKYNRFGMKQERNLLLTNVYLSNLKKKTFQRKIPIVKVKAATKSTQEGCLEFIVHVKQEYDYRFVCDERDEFFRALKKVYYDLNGENLPIYGPNTRLKDYATSKKDMKKGAEIVPEENYRMRGEDLYTPIQRDFGSKSGSIASTAASSTDTSTIESYNNQFPEEYSESTGFREASTTLYARSGDKKVGLQDFLIRKVIGRGSFGKVFLVEKKNTSEVFAMKSLRKDVIIDYDQVESTKLEKEILMQADHPFLVGMHYVFQTEQKIFFVMRFVRGGELFMHLRNSTRFTEDRAKFYAAQVALAIGHLHKKHIIYRDLKPENILMDEDGYICLTDFGLAKILNDNAQAYSFCGTPEYLAPEILNEKGHTFPVDWWALGILTYEMIVGFPPFYTGSNNNLKMYELIRKKPVYFPDPQRHKIKMSDECKDFITKLLDKDPANRLGTKEGLDEIMKHEFFSSISFDELLSKRIEPPFKPKLSADLLDVSNFDTQFTQEEAINSVIPEAKLQQIKKNQEAFNGFTD